MREEKKKVQFLLSSHINTNRGGMYMSGCELVRTRGSMRSTVILREAALKEDRKGSVRASKWKERLS